MKKKFTGKSGTAWALTRNGGVARNADSRIPTLFDTFDEALYCLRQGERQPEGLEMNTEEYPVDRIMVARRAIVDDLTRRGKERDSTVIPVIRGKTVFVAGAGEIACPVCNSGRLRYSRSSYNGHVHGRCTTDGCVFWME